MKGHTKPKGEKIIYSAVPAKVTGAAIVAEFSGGACLTRCPHEGGGTLALRNIRVGSLTCQRCRFFGGAREYAIATGHTAQFGGADRTREIFCTYKGGGQ